MLSFTASCICNSKALQSANQDNLLFSGQILPEVNGGLAGTPTAKFSQNAPFVAGVYDGRGSAGARAACFAAGAFRAVADKLHSEQDLSALLKELHNEFTVKAPADTGISAAAIAIRDDRLCMANFGSCRVYLLRDRALYILSRQESTTAFLGDAGVRSVGPYTLSGVLHSGDRLLLGTDGLWGVLKDTDILRILASEPGSAAMLQSLLQAAKDHGAADSVTAVMLCFD